MDQESWFTLKTVRLEPTAVVQRNFRGLGTGGKVSIRKAQNFNHLSQEKICTLYWHKENVIHLSVSMRTGDFLVYFVYKVLLELFFKIKMLYHKYIKDMSWCQAIADIWNCLLDS